MNVRGLSSNSKKTSDVFNWAKSKNASIVCFQETHSTKDIETRWEDEWGGKCYFSHGDSKSAGVSIMFRSGLDFKVNDLKINENDRYIILDLTVYEQRLTFVCLYGYNTDVPQFFTNLQNLQIQVIYFVVTGMQYKTKVTTHIKYFMTEI
jgi:exonuclease III